MNAPTRDLKAKIWERDELDWYVEPVIATEQLLKVEGFIGVVWDPACGAGNIIEACRRVGLDAVGSDIKQRVARRPSWFLREFDFLKEEPKFDGDLAPNIICNPPFFRAKGAEAFIRRSLAFARGKVAVFVDIRFLAGSERANGLFSDHPPARIWVVTPRVSCPPGSYLAAGNKAGNGSSDWVWLVWDLTAPRTATTFHWLRAVA